MSTEKKENPLWQYRCIMQNARQVEQCLAEYIQAIEEFGLEEPHSDQTPIQCREELLTPKEILRRAGEYADALEQMMLEAAQARNQVLTNILRQSSGLAEYRALRKTYIDNVDDAV